MILPLRTPTPTPGVHAAAVCQVAVTALAVAPLLLVTVCWIPALAVLPFLPDGDRRTRALITRLTTWTRIILTTTPATPAAEAAAGGAAPGTPGRSTTGL